jgi:hypothetical protein
MAIGSSVDNLTQVLMQTNQGGLTKDMISKELMTFGANGVYVFQGVRSRITKYIFDKWALHSMGMHCMVHITNIVV